MSKILTVIIPAYNMEKYLERCLQSLLVEAEKLPLLDIIVINDGSKDSTSQIGHRYQELYPGSIRIVDKENGHYGSCVNRGLMEAEGVFVKILDADDTFDTKVLDQYLDFLSQKDVREGADVVLSDYIQVDDDLNLIDKHPYGKYKNPFSVKDIAPQDRQWLFIHGLTYRTGMLKEMFYQQTTGIAYTDVEWSYYPLSKAGLVFRFEGYLYRYTKLREGQSVEDRVHGKNIWMEAVVTSKIVQRANAVISDANPENVSFIKSQTELIITHLYQLYLLTLYPFVTSFDPLICLDRELKKKYPDLYDKIEDYSTRIAGFTFYPIKDWRKRRMTRLSLQRWLYGVANSKNKLWRRINR